MDLFLPNPERASEIDCSVRDRVAQSLAAIADGLGRQVPDAEPTLGRLVDALRSGPTRAGVFALYADLALAIRAQDADGVMSALASAACLDVSPPPPFRGLTLSDDDLGPGMASRFLRHFDDDPDVPFDVVAPDAEELASARQRLEEATRLLAKLDPPLEQEARNLAREIVFAVDGPGGGEFGSVTTFYLWGAHLINVRNHADPGTLAEAIVHEAAHALLFGHSLGEPLVENDPSERYASPLRPDDRPMDGIVHASFVIARLHYLATRPGAGGRVGRAPATEYERQFRVTDGIVMDNARFTPVGEPLYAAARDYMLSR